LRPTGPATSDRAVRAAVAAAIDVADLIAVGSGNGPAARLATTARTLLPSEKVDGPTDPATAGVPAGLPAMTGDPAAAGALLTAAGFTRVQRSDGTARWIRDGRPLSLVVAAPAERNEYRTIATRVVRQLAAAGIDAQLITPPGDELFAGLAAPPTSDDENPTPTSEPAGAGQYGTGNDPVGGQGPSQDPGQDPSSRATGGGGGAPDGAPGSASGRGVLPNQAGLTDTPDPGRPTGTDDPDPDADQAPPGVDAVDLAVVPRPVSGDPAADLMSWYGCPELDGPAGGTGPQPADAVVPDNPSGYCNRALQATMDDLITGASPIGEALAATEAAVWLDLPSIPLYQHAVVMVTGRGVDAIEPGGLLAGMFANAPRWHRTAR